MKMASRLKDDIMVNKNNETEELLVFGYSCKLFRDDEKALYIDQGKHLIPWMGDETLKIDRYDARGTLFDLKQAEAPSGGFDKFFGLTDMEKQVESLCDEERYRALIANEEEETMYQEEELKRLHYAIGDNGNSYGQVEYRYDGESKVVEKNSEITQPERTDDVGEDEPFIPSPQLDLPLNMVLPETVKHNAIIEKTALFISNQGPQMEILLKMKQARNPQFNFLSFDNPLHNYYRHLLMAFKGGHYKPDNKNANQNTDMENDEDDHYLHPSLASSVSKVELAPSIPSINYKPSAHCAYSMLVNKIKDKKVNDQGSQFSKLKEALERLKEDKKGEENDEGCVRGENDDGSRTPQHTIPPKDMQIIIDKMASYVAKNGRDFETVVQMKNDPRFDFLHPNHVYNSYYQYKTKVYENLERSSKLASTNKCENSNSRVKDEQSKNKLAPVCFSIKKTKDLETVIEKSALPVEESSDEEHKEEKKDKEGDEEKERNGKDEIVTIDLAAIEEKEEKNKKILATERLKDKLTVAAREKVAMASKEKQLQLERKRRAAAFLRTIGSDSGGSRGALTYGPHLPNEADRDAEDGSDVASLPDGPNEFGEVRSDPEKKAPAGKFNRRTDERREKRRRACNSCIRHKHREKQRSQSEKEEKPFSEDQSPREINERITGSSPSSEESERKACYGGKGKRSTEGQWKNKSDRSRVFRKDEKRHKRKKHKKDTFIDRSSRKHSKLKKQKRSKRDEDSRGVKSKRSRRDSTSNSDDQNS